MKLRNVLRIVALAGISCVSFQAFPPAPHHLLFGTVRDEMGNPLVIESARIIMETTSGTKLSARVIPHLAPGENYRLEVPMDAGLTADAYKPTALSPLVPFKMYVRIGEVNYLPIEMKGNFAALGQPSQRTRLDLTLGEDLDGDGLPDAWERAILALMGPGKGLADVNPDDDFDGDGLSNLNEYISGNYAFDKEDGFALKIVGTAGANSVLEFLAIRGRSYTIYGSTDFQSWTPVRFNVAGAGEAGLNRVAYYAEDVRQLRVEALPDEGELLRFFKLMVQ